MAVLETPPSKRPRVDDEHNGLMSSLSVLKESEAQVAVVAEEDAESSNIDASEEDESEDEEDYLELMGQARRRWTPNQLRAKVRKLLQDTDIKITEFQQMLSVNGNSYNKFMNGKYKNQWSAAENQTYDAAARFFLREEKLGAKAVGKQRSAKAGKSNGGKASLPDISAITTDGSTYLTPAEVRRELSKVLKNYKTSLAALARLAGTPGQSFTLFYKAGGEWGGRDNQAYLPAADLIEKLRIATKKQKSQKRLALEAEAVGRGGKPFLGVDPDAKFLCFAGERPCLSRDELGRRTVRFHR